MFNYFRDKGHDCFYWMKKKIFRSLILSDLVVVQIILLAILVLIALIWAYLCKGGSDGNERSISGTVASIARKFSNTSKDLPPSYSRVSFIESSTLNLLLNLFHSQVDLTSVGLSIYDALNPPPAYESAIIITDNACSLNRSPETVIRAVTLTQDLRQLSLQSLPVSSILSTAHSRERKRSVVSEGNAGSRKVSFLDEAKIVVIDDENGKNGE